MKTKIKPILCKLKKYIYCRKLWGFLAILLFLLEIILLVWPIGWLGEEISSFLTGERAWALQTSLENPMYCQEFIPQYANLKSIGIAINEDDISIQGGNMLVTVLDAQSKVLFEKEISYGQILESYMDIDMDLHLKAGKSYFLNIYFESKEFGNIPSLKVYGSDDYMPENVHMIHPEQQDGVHLLTRYIYEDAIPMKKIIRVLFLCVLTAIGVALGLPENKWVRKAMGILLFLLGPYVLGKRLELLTINTTYLLPFSMLWNLSLMYLYELILLLCTQSVKFSVCFSNLSLTLLYSANFYVHSFRGDYLRLNELTAIRTAAKVVNRYNLRPNNHLAVAWCILILFLVYGWQTGIKPKRENSGRKFKFTCHLVTCALGILLTVGSGYILLYTDTLVKAGFFNETGFENKLSYDFDGYLVASFLDIQNSKVTKPEGYSAERAEALLENAGKKVTGQVSEKMPHIILIMNESFSDLRILGNLQISEDNLIFYDSLRDNTIWGYVNASVIGGGTANSEFEVFTGCSMGFLPASYYPYHQCIVREVPSLISDMKDAGYTTYSIHPESAENWNRARVYSYLGFDYSFWKEDFQESETLHAGVSDLETYKKVEELFVNRTEGEKLFIFNLTIKIMADILNQM